MIKNVLTQICPECGSISITRKKYNKFRCNRCTLKFEEVVKVELPFKHYRGQPTRCLDFYPEGRRANPSSLNPNRYPNTF